MWWYMPIIPATQEAERGGLMSETSLGEISVRPYLLKDKVQNKRIWVGLK
jgi:hypothetical protein